MGKNIYVLEVPLIRHDNGPKWKQICISFLCSAYSKDEHRYFSTCCRQLC